MQTTPKPSSAKKPAKKPTPKKRGRGADPEQTKTELADAAFESLRSAGFSGTTARSIGALAGSNQAAIYYHFGGIEALLVDALSRSSVRRLERYQSELDGLTDLSDLLDRLETLYDEDVACGHLEVLAELTGGVTSSPVLREGLELATQPWLAFVEDKIRDVAAQQRFGAFVPAADMADLIFSLIMGLQLRNRLDGRTDRAARLFRLTRLAVAALPDQITNS